jgi:hypothetical protein
VVIYIVDECIYFLTFDIETLLPCLLSCASSLSGATSSTICCFGGFESLDSPLIQLYALVVLSHLMRHWFNYLHKQGLVFSSNKVKVKEGKTHKKKINYLCSYFFQI